MLKAAIVIASLGLLAACATTETASTTTTPSAPAASTPSAPAPAAPAQVADADAEGKRIMESNCTTCHGEDSITSGPRRNEAAWDSTIHRMIGHGAVISEAEIVTLKAYLVKNYGS